MTPEIRRAVSELAFAFADVQRDLARWELEDTHVAAAAVAQRLNVLAIRAEDVKTALRTEVMARARSAA